MSRPNNRKPNDQQRESQDFLANQEDPVDAGSVLVKRMDTENMEPVALVQRSEIQ